MANDILAAHPEAIYRGCDAVFSGNDWLAWDPETVLMELADDVTDAEVDKLCAVQSVAANGSVVCKSAAAFEKVVNAFCNNICVMDVVQPPEVEEMSYAVSQIEKIVRAVHGEETAVEFGGEIPGYVAAVARFRGWFMLPKNLSFAQEALNALTCQHPGSKIYNEHAKILEAVSDFVFNTSRKDARAILESPEMGELAEDDMGSLLVKRFVGALLYDPTLPYQDEK